MKDIRGILAAAFGYIAAIIGAGFASGQEIVSFFVKFGRYGVIGIFLACFGFALFSYTVLSACAENQIYSYTQLMERIFPNRIMRAASQITVLVCSAASFCVMTACAGEIGKIMNTPLIFGSAAFIVLCGVVIFSDGRRVTDINSVLGGIMIVGIVFVCLYILRFREHQVFFSGFSSAALSGAAYAGYNVVGTGAVLAEMSRRIKNKSDAALSAIAAGIILFIMIMLIWGVLAIYYGKINLGEIPMLTMAVRQNKIIGVFYTVMLSAAVLSTGISNGFALTDVLSTKMKRNKAAFFVLAFGLCMSGAGFRYLVDNIYALCGCGGAIVSAIIVIKTLKMNKKARK